MRTVNDISTINPFPGLRPFQENEEYIFFGRENQVDQMVDKLAQTRFLAVIGPSGSGKSSLVNCGLLPALHGGLMSRAGSTWQITQFRPGSDPIASMASALAKNNDIFSDYSTEDLSLVDMFDLTLRMSRLGLVEMFEQSPLAQTTNLLIVVDQFEELFRYQRLETLQAKAKRDVEEDSVAFVNLLLTAHKQPRFPIYIVLTMRSDFLGDCAQFPGLAESINAGQYLVPRLTRSERREAIRGPIYVNGAEISSVLLTRLVNDVGSNPDQLSILQHALNRTWDKWKSEGAHGPLDLEHYEAVGEMKLALDSHAEEAYDELDSTQQKTICKKLFQALTDKATDPRGIRRPTKLGMLQDLIDEDLDDIIAVINVFRTPTRSFLMPPAGEALGNETVIDISHESLMRVWKRLGKWADDEAESAKIYQRLADSAIAYENGKANLIKEPELSLRVKWRESHQPNSAWGKRYDPHFEEAFTFLEESVACQKQEIEQLEMARHEEVSRQIREVEETERATARQREIRRLRKFTVLLGGMSCLLLGSALWGVMNWKTAELRKEQIELSNQVLKIKNIFDSNQQLESLIKGIEVGNQIKAKGLKVPSDIRMSAIASLQEVIYNIQEKNQLMGHSDTITGLSYSPDGTMIATASYDKTVKLWSPDGALIQSLPEKDRPNDGHEKIIYTLGFSPDSKTIATGSFDNTVKLWNIEDRSVQTIPVGGPVNSIAYSPDGNLLAIAKDISDPQNNQNQNYILELKNLRTQKSQFLKYHKEPITSLDFSDDNNYLVTGSFDNSVKIWQLKNNRGSLPNTISFDKPVQNVSFRPQDSQLLAIGGDDHTITLQGLMSGKDAKLKGHRERVNSVKFSQNGKLLASGSFDNTAKVWDIDGKLLHTFKAKGNVENVDFSPDQNNLATSQHKTVSLWSLTKLSPLVLKDTVEQKFISDIQVSSEGDFLVTSSYLGNAKLWTLDGPEAISSLQPRIFKHESVYSVGISSDGKFVVTGGGDGSIKIWNSDGHEIKTDKSHHAAVNSISVSPNGQLFATGSADQTVKLWNLDGQLIDNFRNNDESINSVSFSPDGTLLIIGSSQKTVKIVNLNGKILETLSGHHDSVNSAIFSPTGKTVATASEDNLVKLWGLDGELINTLKGHSGPVDSIAFTSDGTMIATGSRDRTVRIWNLEGQLLHTHTLNTPATSISFGNEDKYLAIGSNQNTQLINLDLDDLIKKGCEWLDDYLSSNPPENSYSSDAPCLKS